MIGRQPAQNKLLARYQVGLGSPVAGAPRSRKSGLKKRVHPDWQGARSAYGRVHFWGQKPGSWSKTAFWGTGKPLDQPIKRKKHGVSRRILKIRPKNFSFFCKTEMEPRWGDTLALPHLLFQTSWFGLEQTLRS